MHYLLFYDYVDDIAERRTPFRDAHLGHVKAYAERGEVLLAGAFADPLDGAAIVFAVADREAVEAFVAADPYVRNGLVTRWHVRAWTVVVGAALDPRTAR